MDDAPAEPRQGRRPTRPRSPATPSPPVVPYRPRTALRHHSEPLISMASKRLPSKLSSLLVTVPNLSAAAQAKLGQTFAHVHSHPGGEGLTADVLAEVDMAFTTNRALADHVRDFKEETPKLELVHLCSSGAAFLPTSRPCDLRSELSRSPGRHADL